MCQKKRRMQSKYLGQIGDLYADEFHVVPMPMLGDEVRGLERLRRLNNNDSNNDNDNGDKLIMITTTTTNNNY